jgi:hypothetical protein
MSTIDMWNLIVGFLSATFVLPLIQRPETQWSKRRRSVVTVGYCLIVGAGTTWITGGLDQDWAHDVRAAATAVLLVFVSAIATYRGFAKPSGLAAAIENATSPTPPITTPTGPTINRPLSDGVSS